jgi:hypothetical protein
MVKGWEGVAGIDVAGDGNRRLLWSRKSQFRISYNFETVKQLLLSAEELFYTELVSRLQAYIG